jgi:thiamine kinase-like enzyme
MSLVIWEIMSRSEEKETNFLHSTPYTPPYGEYLTTSTDEDINEIELRRVVCELKQRPTLKSEWRSHTIFNELCDILEELWTEVPDARLNSFRLCKTLNKLKFNYEAKQQTQCIEESCVA